MGVDYSSYIGYGFKVDEQAVRDAVGEEFWEDGGGYEALEEVLKGYSTLAYSVGGSSYSGELEFAIVNARMGTEQEPHYGPYGVFPLGSETLNSVENFELKDAHVKYGASPIGAIATFHVY